MKDTLHRDPTAYDVLGVAPNASTEAIDASVPAALDRGVPWDIVRAAKAELDDSATRGQLDLFYYDDAVLRRLDPNPTETPEALAVCNRAETAERWTAQLRAAFPAPGLAHAIGLLWYWWGVHQERLLMSLWRRIVLAGGQPEPPLNAFDLMRVLAGMEGHECRPGNGVCPREDCPWRSDCVGLVPTPHDTWSGCIACWGHVLATDGFWMDRYGLDRGQARQACAQARDRFLAWFRTPAERFAALELPSVPDATWGGVRNAVPASPGVTADDPVTVPPPPTALAELESLYARLGDEAGREFALAADMAAAGLTVGRHRVCCGRLLLERLGLLDRVSAEVEAELQRHPESLPLSRIRGQLSPYGEIVALVDGGHAQEALDALAALPPAEQQRNEVRALRASARGVLACKALRDGDWQQGLKACKEALAEPSPDATRRRIAAEVSGVCADCADATAASSLDNAIQFLRRVVQVLPNRAIELALGKFLARRGLQRLGQFEADLRQGTGPPAKSTVEALEQSLADLHDAVRLGFTEYAEHVARARRLLREAELGFLGLPRKMQQMLGTAYIAMEKGNWDRAAALLRKVLAKVDKSSAGPIRRHLAEVLSRRGEERTEQGMRLLGLKEDLSRLFAIAPDDSRRQAMAELDLAMADFNEAVSIDSRLETRLSRFQSHVTHVLERERQAPARAPRRPASLAAATGGPALSAWFRVSSVFCFLVIVLAIVGYGGWGYLVAVLPFLLLVFVFFTFFVR